MFNLELKYLTDSNPEVSKPHKSFFFVYKYSIFQELLEHQHQKMQQQLERIRFEAISKASVVSTPCQNAQVRLLQAHTAAILHF